MSQSESEGDRRNGRSKDRSSGVVTRRALLARAGVAGLAALGAPAVLAACASPQQQTPSAATAGASVESAAPLKPIRVGIPIDSPLDPAKMGFGTWAGTFASLAYAPILHLKPDGTLGPGLATAWRFVDGGRGPNKDFELTLRKDAKFNDGTLVTAQAVAGWLTYFSKAQGPYSNLLGADPKFEAADDATVRIHLNAPAPSLPLYLSEGQNWGYVASPKAVAEPTLFTNAMPGAGPYMVDPSQSVRGDHYTFVPNPNYYDKSAVKFSQVYVKMIGVASSMLQTVQSGQLDLAYGDVTTMAAAESAGLTVAWAPLYEKLLLLSPQLAPPLGDVRV